jgi:hypothetical protein
MDGMLPEVIFRLGGVAFVPYAAPGTRALAEVFGWFLPARDAGGSGGPTRDFRT